MKFKFHSGEKVLCFEPDPTKARAPYGCQLRAAEGQGGEAWPGTLDGGERDAGADGAAARGSGGPAPLLAAPRPARRSTAAGAASRSAAMGVGAGTLPLPPWAWATPAPLET